MRKPIAIVALMAVAAAAPASAHVKKRHHHHAAVAYPDSVTLEGKEYKVCKPGMEDDCVNPRQAGLGFGNRPIDRYLPREAANPHP